jgi:hypothetical protein
MCLGRVQAQVAYGDCVALWGAAAGVIGTVRWQVTHWSSTVRISVVVQAQVEGFRQDLADRDSQMAAACAERDRHAAAATDAASGRARAEHGLAAAQRAAASAAEAAAAALASEAEARRRAEAQLREQADAHAAALERRDKEHAARLADLEQRSKEAVVRLDSQVETLASQLGVRLRFVGCLDGYNGVR